ncbi:hypothetical protein NLU13_9122 [Sarocladium strictum]|uniref:RBR-type E3 ubiquitin transferase n=1 Tax=Sarocladium strictum TaxID=5046 RepID=A0AA39L449_SARSR|nr:hypothetical protein NLU13_9122 [Sarocladium strictum]
MPCSSHVFLPPFRRNHSTLSVSVHLQVDTMMKRTPVQESPGTTPEPRAVMPGSFFSHEELLAQIDNEVFHNPWDSSKGVVDHVSTLERIQDLVATAAESEQQEVQWDDVDWRKFEPPPALRKTANITSHILLDIVQSSIDRVRERAREERRQELMAEEQRLLEELEQLKAKQKGKEPYLPILMVQDKPLPGLPRSSRSGVQSSSQQRPALQPTASSDPIASRSSDDKSLPSLPAAGLVVLPGSQRIHKPRESAIRRLFKRSTERGESSAQGSAREGLLQRLMEPKAGSSSASEEQKTDDAVAKLKRRLKAVQEPESLLECVSCLEDLPLRDCIKVQCHAYCKDCFVRLVTAACENETQWPPKCCLNNIPFPLIRKNVPSALKNTFNERSNEWNIPIAERVYCWRAECGLFIRPGNIKTSTSTGQCDRGHWTCLNCRNEGHGQDDCPMDEAMILTNQIAEDEGWRRCYKCRALVEHSEACQHMTCRCGAEFCYVCGLQWRTCRCSITDLDNVKARANERREQRKLREDAKDADAQELRAILRQIEEFEREEARRAEVIAEQDRMAAQKRREQELLRRAQAESARIRDIGLKYQHLRESLDGLHDLQLALLEMDQQEASASQVAEELEIITQLEAKHEVKREEMATNLKAKISAREHAFAKEYRLRVNMEAKVESKFREQLQEFWGDREDGAVASESAMLRLQQRMDRRFLEWQMWQGQTIRQLRESLEEEVTVQNELMWSAEQLLKTRLEAGRKDLSKKMVAERKWIEVVMLEREKMVNEKEVEEIEGDADRLDETDEMSI